MAGVSLTLTRADDETIDYVERLLATADLPTADVREKSECFYLAEQRDRLVGVGGLEVHGDAALLRSVAVEPSERGHGLGTVLVDALEARATDAGVAELYLLTETAATFFADRGFETTERSAAPTAIRETTEFAELCSESAVCMWKAL